MVYWKDLVGKGVVIFSKPQCPFCVRSKKFFKGIKVDAVEHDISTWEFDEVEKLKIESAHMTFPNIWMGKMKVGGFDNLKRIHESGQLYHLLKEEGISFEEIKPGK